MTINYRGISTFFFSAIPAVLALAALWWLAFGQGLHYFRRELSQERRRAEIVGAKTLPKEPIKIVVQMGPRDDPIAVDRAEIDGGDLWIYYKNVSPGNVKNIRFQWRLIAPDGTVLKSKSGYASVYGENDAPDSLEAGERGELHLKLDSDPRATSLQIKMY